MYKHPNTVLGLRHREKHDPHCGTHHDRGTIGDSHLAAWNRERVSQYLGLGWTVRPQRAASATRLQATEALYYLLSTTTGRIGVVHGSETNHHTPWCGYPPVLLLHWCCMGLITRAEHCSGPGITLAGATIEMDPQGPFQPLTTIMDRRPLGCVCDETSQRRMNPRPWHPVVRIAIDPLDPYPIWRTSSPTHQAPSPCAHRHRLDPCRTPQESYSGTIGKQSKWVGGRDRRRGGRDGRRGDGGRG